MKIKLKLSNKAIEELNRRCNILCTNRTAVIQLLWLINLNKNISMNEIKNIEVQYDNVMQIQISDYLVENFKTAHTNLSETLNGYSLYVEYLLTSDTWDYSKYSTEKQDVQMTLDIREDIFNELKNIKDNTGISYRGMLNYSIYYFGINTNIEPPLKGFGKQKSVNVFVPHFHKQLIDEARKVQMFTNNKIAMQLLEKFIEMYRI